MVKAKLAELDTALYFAVFRPQPKNWCRLAALALSKSGNGGLYVLVALGCALFLEQLGRQFALTAVLAFAIERPLYFYCKNRFARLRPCDCFAVKALLKPSDKFSLPSGHSAGAWLFATCLMEQIPSLSLALIVWACGVSLSRVIVGVHYPLDVVLGGAMGSACAALAIIIIGSL